MSEGFKNPRQTFEFPLPTVGRWSGDWSIQTPLKRLGKENIAAVGMWKAVGQLNYNPQDR